MYSTMEDAYLQHGIEVPYRENNNKYESTEQDVLKFITNMLASLKYGTNPKEIGILFDKDAVLFGIFSGEFITSNQKIVDYFRNFLQISGLRSDIPEKHSIQKMGDSIWGCYLYVPFHFGNKESIISRMTFILENKHGDFQINMLHGSIL